MAEYIIKNNNCRLIDSKHKKQSQPSVQLIDNRQSNNTLQRYVIKVDGGYILSKTNPISCGSIVAAVYNDRSTIVKIYNPDELTFSAQKLLGNPNPFDVVYSHIYMENMVKIARDKAQKNKQFPKDYLTDDSNIEEISWKDIKTDYETLKNFLVDVQQQRDANKTLLIRNQELIEKYKNPQSSFYYYGFKDVIGASIMILQGMPAETLEIEKTLAIIAQDLRFIQLIMDDQESKNQLLPGYFNGYDCEAFAKVGNKFFNLEFSYYKGELGCPGYAENPNREKGLKIEPKVSTSSTTGYSFHCWNTLTQQITGGGELTAETCAGQGGPFSVVFCIRPIGCNENVTVDDDIKILDEAGRKSREYQQVLNDFKSINSDIR